MFLSLEHLEDIVGLLIGLISILLFVRKQEGVRRGSEMGEWPVGGAARTHSVHTLGLPVYVGVFHGRPKQLQQCHQR